MKTKVARTIPGKLAAINARDLQRINDAAERLNLEAEDVLQYQREPRTDDVTQH